MSYDSKFLYIHANRRRKKRKGPTINPEYRLELKGLNARELGYVVEKEFGDGQQAAGVEFSLLTMTGRHTAIRCETSGQSLE